MVDLVKMLSHRKGDASNYRPTAGTRCLISGPNCDDEKGYTYGEYCVLWSDDIFVVYRKDGCWPVIRKWEHVIAKSLYTPPAIQQEGAALDERAADWTQVDATPMRRAFEQRSKEHHNDGCVKRGLSQKAGSPNSYIHFDMNVEWGVWKDACAWQARAALAAPAPVQPRPLSAYTVLTGPFGYNITAPAGYKIVVVDDITVRFIPVTKTDK